jgi:hypothetical protein
MPELAFGLGHMLISEAYAAKDIKARLVKFSPRNFRSLFAVEELAGLTNLLATLALFEAGECKT